MCMYIHNNIEKKGGKGQKAKRDGMMIRLLSGRSDEMI